MTFLELYRRDAAGRIVAALWVVEHLDVNEHIGAGILPGWIDLAANPLSLEQLEEALSHGVVVAVASPAHAAEQVVVPQETLPVVARELTAFIGVHQHRVFGLSAPQRHQQSIEHKFCVDAAGHGPANHLAGEQIKHHGQIQPTLVGTDLGDVRNPGLVWTLRRELPLQMVRCHHGRLAATTPSAAPVARL